MEGETLTHGSWLKRMDELLTKADLAAMLQELKDAYQSGLKELKNDLSHLGQSERH